MSELATLIESFLNSQVGTVLTQDAVNAFVSLVNSHLNSSAVPPQPMR
jgi:hypothetical protein